MKLKSKFIKLTNESRLYNLEVPIIGLTGGIATGKSTVSKILEEKGLAIICADLLVRSVYKTAESKEFIKNEFPKAIQNEEINFSLLREIAFSDKANKEKLEQYIYSHLPNEFLKATKSIPSNSLIIYDVPLLFEKKLDSKVDLSICVYANQELQIKRLMQRDSTDEGLAKNILKNQMPIEQKKDLSDFIINNELGLKDLKSTIDNLLKELFE
jgi:dephospho-CoA kinase